jgi:outer membrane protein assembly factor BamB
MSGPAYDLPVVEDINGDGSPEVIFHSQSQDAPAREKCSCLDANGKLLWSTRIDPVLQTGVADESVSDVSGAPVVVADFLGNGKLQILCLTDTTLTLLDESGRIIWKSPTGIWGVSRRTVRNMESLPLSLKLAPKTLLKGAAVGDIDGDGLLEIVIGLWPDHNLECDIEAASSHMKNCTCKNVSPSRNSLAAFRGSDGKLLWSYDSKLPCPDGQGMSAPIIADINGDGTAEVIACSGDGHVHALRGTDGNMIWQMPVGVKDAGRVIFTDINGDTFGELVVTSGDKVAVIGPV